MKITFCGAASDVTGSNYLIETKDKKIIIDCGLFQGTREEEDKNWRNFSFMPQEIDAVIVTHSHIDHIGLLPKLYKDGFRGKIYSTPATKDLSAIFLPDSCELLSKLATRTERNELYNIQDVESVLNLFVPIAYHTKTEIFPNVFFTFFDAGHILGSSFVLLEIENKKIVFSGDLGNPPVPIIKDTEYIKDIDYVIMESTYGGKVHDPSESRRDQLENVIEDAFTRRGTLLIPAFAMERTQELLYEINSLISENRIPKIPVYIDSPLAEKATAIYPKYVNDFDLEAKEKIKQGIDLFNFPELKIISAVEDSKALDRNKEPKIIIAGSGMSTGGRIVHHELEFLPSESTTLLIIGYQVQGSLGRHLEDGEKEIRIRGKLIPVNAKIVSLNSYSAHADQPKLLFWLKNMGAQDIKTIYLTHGEDQSKLDLKTKIQDELGVKTVISKENMKETL